MESPQNQSNLLNDKMISETDSAALLPHLETFDKMLKLPVVEAAWQQSQDVYGRVKGEKILFSFHPFFSSWNSISLI